MEPTAIEAARANAKPSVQRGRPTSKGLPKGVTGPLAKRGKYQARVSYKPAGILQRNLGLFFTVEEAEAAIAGAIADLTTGHDPWHSKPVHERQHKRGLVSFKPALVHTNRLCADHERLLLAGATTEAEDRTQEGRHHQAQEAKSRCFPDARIRRQVRKRIRR